MPSVKEIYEFIDSFAPYSTACDWDNTGISVGDAEKQVSKIVFALDITSEVVEFSKHEKADLIITHHPLIFKPIKNVLSDSITYTLVNSGIAHISAHTNFDMAKEGVNAVLCKKLSLNIKKSITDDDICLYICNTEKPISLDDFVSSVKEKLGGTVRFNSVKKPVNTVAVCSGAGAEYLAEAKENCADVLLTGDGSHHDFLDADEMGIALVCAGHFETENPAVDLLIKKISEKFNVACVKCPQTTPIKTI